MTENQEQRKLNISLEQTAYFRRKKITQYNMYNQNQFLLPIKELIREDKKTTRSMSNN